MSIQYSSKPDQNDPGLISGPIVGRVEFVDIDLANHTWTFLARLRENCNLELERLDSRLMGHGQLRLKLKGVRSTARGRGANRDRLLTVKQTKEIRNCIFENIADGSLDKTTGDMALGNLTRYAEWSKIYWELYKGGPYCAHNHVARWIEHTASQVADSEMKFFYSHRNQDLMKFCSDMVTSSWSGQMPTAAEFGVKFLTDILTSPRNLRTYYLSHDQNPNPTLGKILECLQAEQNTTGAVIYCPTPNLAVYLKDWLGQRLGVNQVGVAIDACRLDEVKARGLSEVEKSGQLGKFRAGGLRVLITDIPTLIPVLEPAVAIYWSPTPFGRMPSKFDRCYLFCNTGARDRAAYQAMFNF